MVQTPPTNAFLENDDEAERIARRRELSMSNTTSPNTNSRRVSLGLGFLASIPAPQMAESINQCIKLSAENKINVKNAFSLEMIDFMTYMIKKQDANMSNLQVASTSLDVSTKIYGYRVDSVHMEILKMIGGMDKQAAGDTEQSTEEQETTQESAEGTESRKKKKKKTRQKIFNTVEGLKGNIEIAKPISAMIGEGDLQTSDMLYQATLPNHANSGFYQHPYNDVLVDVLENTPESRSNSNAKYDIPPIEDFLDLEICRSYSNFEFLGWSVEDEPEEMSEEEAGPSNESGNRFQFDLDANVEYDSDPAPEPMNYFNIEHDDDNDNNAQTCYQKAENYPNLNIVDASDVRTSEYSFIQPNVNLHWAGPSHWKFWNLRSSITIEGDSKVVACKQAKQRKKKQFELLYDDIDTALTNAKFASSQSVTLQAKNVKMEWNSESLVLPEDIHYDIAQMSRLYLHQKLSICPANNEKKDANVVTTADVSDGERYDYNNPNDTLEYCPNVEHDDDYEDYGSRDGNDDCNFDDNVIALGSQGLTGDNLVAAPKLINKISIPYCLRAKKIDMRQLKRSIWSCLKSTSDNAVAANTEKTANETDTMKESKKFSDVYKTLPTLLTKSNAEALSVPISFISMLHLANEKGLKVCSVSDFSDITIEPGDNDLSPDD